MRVVHTRVFANAKNGGNPCPVVTGADHLNACSMQALARYFGLDTVFLLQPQCDGNVRMRYFVPEREMGISGHATIAGITVALKAGVVRLGQLVIETINGSFTAGAAVAFRETVVTLEQRQPTFTNEVSASAVAEALNIDVDDISLSRGPIQAVSASRAKLIVPIKDWKTLNQLRPNYELLWRTCEEVGVTGFYPFTGFTDKPRADVEARQFPLRAGFLEDAATGVAAAALGGYLARYHEGSQPGCFQYRIAQGYAMGAPSNIRVIVDKSGNTVTRIAIRGSATIVSVDDVAC